MHSQGQAIKGESGPLQVYTSGDVYIPCISNTRTHPFSDNFVHDAGTVLVANS